MGPPLHFLGTLIDTTYMERGSMAEHKGLLSGLLYREPCFDGSKPMMPFIDGPSVVCLAAQNFWKVLASFP